MTTLRKTMHFPDRLHLMLDSAEREGFDATVSWLPCGTAFKVHDAKRFTESIMPRYYDRQTRYKSFLRQLNLYNFKRSARFGAYAHQSFIRGKPELSKSMARTKIKGSSIFSSKPISAEQRPWPVTSAFAGFASPPHLVIGSSSLFGSRSNPAVKEENQFFETTMTELDQSFVPAPLEEHMPLNAGFVCRVSIHQEDITDEIIRFFSSSW